MTDHVEILHGESPSPEVLVHEPGGGTIRAAFVSTEPSALLLLLRCVALKWLSLTCARDARSFVDAGQDLVADFSAFIGDFTVNEKSLCDLVEGFVQAARSAGMTLPS